MPRPPLPRSIVPADISKVLLLLARLDHPQPGAVKAVMLYLEVRIWIHTYSM